MLVRIACLRESGGVLGLRGGHSAASFSLLRRLWSGGAVSRLGAADGRSPRGLDAVSLDWNSPRREGHRPSDSRSEAVSSVSPARGGRGRRPGRRVRARREAPRAVTRRHGRANPAGPQGRLLDKEEKVLTGADGHRWTDPGAHPGGQSSGWEATAVLRSRAALLRHHP